MIYSSVVASAMADLARVLSVAPRMLPCRFGPDDRYELEELIGYGHDAHVYRARDLHLSRPSVPALVAIKIRESAIGGRAEAVLGRSVQHPNVVRTIEHGDLGDGTSYLVQEWVAGGDLSEVSVPIGPREAAGLAAQIARGVAAVHAAGIVHGDLKPSNVLRTPEGEPKVADFDLASADDLQERVRGGNLAFMAPERALDESAPVTPVSDVYALSGMLHYFLFGRPPGGRTSEQILEFHREGREPVLDALPPDLARVCRRGLAPRPEDRYQSAEAFSTDLECILARRPLRSMPTPPIRRARLLVRRHPFACALGALGIAAVVATAGWARQTYLRELETQRRAADIADRRFETLKNDLGSTAATILASPAFQDESVADPGVFHYLLMLDWLSRTPLLSDPGKMFARSSMLPTLEKLRRLNRERSRDGSLYDALMAYCMAYICIEIDQTPVARRPLADAERHLGPRLSEGEHMHRSLLALRGLLEYELGEGSVDSAAQRDALRAELIALRTVDEHDPTAALIEKVLARNPGP